MPEKAEKGEKGLSRLRGRMARTRSIGTKLTPDEECQILVAAQTDGKVPSQWVRDLLLRGTVVTNQRGMEMHLFTELVGVQMLLMNVLDPLLRGETMTREQLAALYRRIQTTKAVHAQQLLARRSLNRKERND